MGPLWVKANLAEEPLLARAKIHCRAFMGKDKNGLWGLYGMDKLGGPDVIISKVFFIIGFPAQNFGYINCLSIKLSIICEDKILNSRKL